MSDTSHQAADPYALLSLPRTLVIDNDRLRAAFREAGKSAHPDANGNPADFEALRAAHDTLASPARRLVHWLASAGHPSDTRGTVNASLMDLFTLVGNTVREAGETATKRSSARSALALALLEADTQRAMESIEQAIADVDAAIARETSTFPDIESGTIHSPEELARIARNLLFLEKWRASLRALPPRLM